MHLFAIYIMHQKKYKCNGFRKDAEYRKREKEIEINKNNWKTI